MIPASPEPEEERTSTGTRGQEDKRSTVLSEVFERDRDREKEKDDSGEGKRIIMTDDATYNAL